MDELFDFFDLGPGPTEEEFAECERYWAEQKRIRQEFIDLLIDERKQRCGLLGVQFICSDPEQLLGEWEYHLERWQWQQM